MTEKLCANCGEINPVDVNFCSNCGAGEFNDVPPRLHTRLTNDTESVRSSAVIINISRVILASILSVGLYFNYSDFSVDNPANPLKYRIYDFGGYAKLIFSPAKKFTPYVRGELGLVMPNLATPIISSPPDPAGFREIAYSSGIGAGGFLGLRLSTFEYGGLFAEVGYRAEIISAKSGSFAGVTYELPADINNIQLNFGFNLDFGPKQ